MVKKRFGGDRVDVRNLLGTDFAGTSVGDLEGEDGIELEALAHRDALLPLLIQLREFGVLGEDGELEELLAEARFDVQRALNLYLDRGSALCTNVRRPMQAGELTGEVSRSGEAAVLIARCRGGGRRGSGYGARAAEGAKGVDSKTTARPLRSRPKPLSPGRDKASGEGHKHDVGWRSEVRVLPIGQDGLARPCGVQYVAADGGTVEINVCTMRQVDPETGISQEVRRINSGAWRVQTGPRKWSQYPNEVCRELERLHLESQQPLEERSSPQKPASVSTAKVSLEVSLRKALEHAVAATPGAMSAEEVQEAKGLAFEAAAQEPHQAAAAAKLLECLVAKQGLCCGAPDARLAGLIVGSMALLRAVLRSDAGMALVGVEVFDQRYPSLKLNVPGRKNGVRSLLARGMTLGAYAPSSKLLRKIEADSQPIWEERFLQAMMNACPLLPERTRDQVRDFLA